MGKVDCEAVRGFLGEMYGDAIGTAESLVLWSSHDKRSHWVSGLDEAVSVAEAQASSSDLYFGVCLQDKVRAEEERKRRTGDARMDFARGYAMTASVMPGLWLDLDIAGPGHEKIGLPRNQADADRILDALPLEHSWRVITGGGTHIYWLFREPWRLETEEERDRAAAMIRGWQTLAIDAAANMGFTVDATHDLARVLRPAGTVNHKYGCGVRLVDRVGDGPRFNPSDFDDWAMPLEPLMAPAHSRKEDLGDLHPDIQPPPEKLMAMLNLAPQFAATWRRERKEFPSQSEYDMSLASMAARAGWKDEEIVALVVSHRRDGDEPLRLDRPAYYTGLIGKAKKGLVADEAHERINERVEAVQMGEVEPEDEREGFLTDISSLLGFRIRRVLKFITDPPQYRLVLEEGCIHLGGVESILNPTKFRASIAAVSGHLIQRFNGTRWDPVAQAILQAVEELDLGADSSAEGLVDEWLGEYLAQHKPSDERQDAIAIREPFFDPDGQPAFFLSEFRSWLAFHRDERLGRRQIATLLRSASCTPRVVSYTREPDGHKSTVHVWVAPPSVSTRLPRRDISSLDTESPKGSLNG